MRRAFTLIELLVIIAIMATMVSVGVVSLNASRGATRTFGAARDVMAMVRRARSLALVTQKDVVLSYSNGRFEDEPCAKVEIEAASLFSARRDVERVETLSGEVVREAQKADAKGEQEVGETLEEVLSPQAIPESVMKGLKVLVADESSAWSLPENESRRSKISIFSTADNISRTLSSATKKNETAEEGQDGEKADLEGASEDLFRVAFTANGMASPPHRVVIYRADARAEDGIVLHIDRFGEVTCEKLD